MSIQSMTGFGKANRETDLYLIQTEIKSLNSKGIDLSIRMPSQFREKEIELRNEIQKLLERGKIDISISIENKQTQSAFKLNSELAKVYYTELKKLSEELNDLQFNVLSEIIKMPDVIKNDKKEFNEQDWLIVRDCLMEAVSSLKKFRSDEGNSIQLDFERQINSIIDKLNIIKEIDINRIETVKARIKKSLTEFISNDTIDQNRFEQELIYYLEKMDINEEKVRLATHCNYFIETMREPACGRKLNFISQEIGREINTIGSKANDAKVQKLVVEMKDELEKIKEQTSNVL
jgi:uncharacterized protein (TIGR00255 family)